MAGIKIKTGPPGPRARKLVSLDKKYSVISTMAYPLVIKTGKGSYLEDVDGNRFLDFASNVASTPLGYKHPAHMKVLKRFTKQGAHKIAGQDFYCEEKVKLAKKLMEITPKKLTKIFLINSGAEAVENAIKFAYRKIGPFTGISCHGAFHGRTLGALSLTASKPVQKKNYPQLKVKRIKFCEDDDDPAIDQIEKAAKKGRTAFIIVEPVQGEGGYNIASKKFLKNLQKRAREIGVPLIVDEVQAGLGRTGKWWGFQHFGISPDIITSAKGLQVGATISSSKYAPKEESAVSSTWGGGHRIDMAIGLATIETIEREKLMKNVNKMSRFFMKRLNEIHQDCAAAIQTTGGLGLMMKFRLCTPKTRDRMVQKCFRNGLLTLPSGSDSVRIVPPLNITKTDAERGIRVMAAAAKELNKRVEK